MRTLFSLLLGVLLCCGCASTPPSAATPAAPSHSNPSAPPGLIGFIAQARDAGTGLLCDESALLRRLSMYMGEGRLVQNGGDSNMTQALLGAEDSPVIDGTHRQFKSATTHFCSVDLDLRHDSLCNIDSKDYREAVGPAMPYLPPHPQPGIWWRSYSHLFLHPDGKRRTEVWLQIPDGRSCVARLIVRAYD